LSSSPDEASRYALPFGEEAQVGIAADLDSEGKVSLLLRHSLRSSIHTLNTHTQPQLYAIVALLKIWIKQERHKSNIIFPSEVRV
jgi:hypothetical protein